MSKLGLAVLGASVLVCAVLFAGLPNIKDPIALFSQFLGSAALILMAWAQLMATRLPLVEPLFGGLDRVYVLHKWSGILALGAILLHDTIDADMASLGADTALVELGETLGEISLYGILILCVISIATFIPYHLWKWTHRLMGGFFVAGALHYLLELKPFSNFGDTLGLYLAAFCVLGLAAYAYTLLPESARRARRYAVSSVRATGGATEITLAPEGRGIKPAPGQFAIFSFGQTGLTEPHPYSLSAPAHADGSLQITVKALGDYTHRLGRDLKAGTTARVQGPFGRFTRRTGKSGTEVWIAGGIGITPFLAWAEALTPEDKTEIHLFWAVRSEAEAPQLDRVRAAVAAHPGVTLHLCVSSEGSRLTPEAIADQADMASAKVWFCGPAPMRRSLYDALSRRGLSQSRFHYEEFEFRTGIGLKRLARALEGQLAKRTS